MIQHYRKINEDTLSRNVEMKDEFENNNKKEDNLSRKQKKDSTNG